MGAVVGGVLKDFGLDGFKLSSFCFGDIAGVGHAVRDSFG